MHTEGMAQLREFRKDTIWLKEYPVRYAGTSFLSRMTIIRLNDETLFVHSPSEIDDGTRHAINALGHVSFIVAPGSYHSLHVRSAQEAFPDAETFICPGIERKLPDLEFDGILGDRPDPRWQEDFEQVLVRGNRLIWEVAFFHKPTQTLVLVDLIENITDDTEGTDLMLKFWWKWVFHMWNNPRPAPEYQIGWKDRRAASRSLRRIIKWDFEAIIIAHGDLIEANARQVAEKAWAKPLSWDSGSPG